MTPKVEIVYRGINGFTPIDPHTAANPSNRVFLSSSISTNHLDKFGKFEYFKNAKSLWIDAMQKWVVSYVNLIRDPECPDEIFIFFNVQNDASHQVFLGKLDHGCTLFEIVNKAFREFKFET